MSNLCNGITKRIQIKKWNFKVIISITVSTGISFLNLFYDPLLIAFKAITFNKNYMKVVAFKVYNCS